jgi:hypothetical protein
MSYEATNSTGIGTIHANVHTKIDNQPNASQLYYHVYECCLQMNGDNE